jgi:hypothetical protein
MPANESMKLDGEAISGLRGADLLRVIVTMLWMLLLIVQRDC